MEYEEGDIADGPNGPLVFRGGSWVPMQDQQPSGGIRIGTPNPYAQPQAAVDYQSSLARARQAALEAAKTEQEAQRGYKIPEGYRPNAAGTGIERIPGYAPSATEVEQGKAKDSLQKRAGVVRQQMSIVRDLYNRNLKGQPLSRGFGLSEYVDAIPNNDEFRAASNAMLPLIRPLVAQSAKEGDSDKEMQVFMAYIPSNDDSDQTVERKLQMLDLLIGGMAEGKAPSETVSNPGAVGNSSNQQAIGVNALLPGGNGSPPTPSGPAGGGPSGIAPAGTVLAFNDEARPSTGLRLSGEQEASVMAAIRAGDQGQALSLLQQFTGNAPDQGTAEGVASAIAAVRQNPRANISLNYGAVDAAAQEAEDRKRYGDQLAPALRERSNASGLDVSVRNGVNGLTAGLADRLAAATATLGGVPYDQALQRQQALTEADSRLSPTNSFVSNIVGGGIGAALGETAAARLLPGAMAGTWAPRIGDAAYGATAGYTGAAPGSETSGAVTGAGAGLFGGMLGRGATRAAGNSLRGVRNASTDYLRNRGVPLTVGQLVGQSGPVGRAAKGIEDRLSGIPVVGDAVNARRREGFEAFNRTAFDEGLAPINANTGGVIQEQGIDAAQVATQQGYRDALSGVSAVRDPQFTGEYASAVNRGTAIPRVGPEFEAWAQADLDPLVSQPVFDGRTVQDFLQQTRKADFGNDAMGDLAGRAVGDAEGAMRGLVSRQAPDVLPALGRADQAFRRTEILRDAVNRARNGTRTGETGMFAPSQLSDAAAANSRRFGNSQGTTRQPFFDLTRAGQEVLPNSIPDSGTAGRLATLALPAALGGGGGYAGGETGAGTGLGIGAALALGGTRGGQRVLTQLLAERPDALIRAGEQLNRRARIGGIFGAPLLAGYSQ